MIQILHIVEDFSIRSGGLRTVIENLRNHSDKHGIRSYILSSDEEKNDNIFVVKANNKWLFSRSWKNKIREIVIEKNISIIHIHGVWLFPQLVGAKFAIQQNIPMVLSCHGMLQPWLWKKGTLKKKIYFQFLSKKWFTKARIIHAITNQETKNLKNTFRNNKIIEIPNLCDFNLSQKPSNLEEKYILYLGRLNKTKGIDLLIKAFSRIKSKDVILKIAGNYNEYKKDLDGLVALLNLKNKVQFLGLVHGPVKDRLIKEAWVMASPTYSDVIGMVNLEAASLRTPMITTLDTGLKKEWNLEGGILINPNEQELFVALSDALNWTLKERNKRGESLFNFAKRHYSWKARINDWLCLYKSIVDDEK